MTRVRRMISVALVGGGPSLLVGMACQSGNGESGFGNDGGGPPGGEAGLMDVPSIGANDGSGANGDGGVPCPAGLQCNVACTGGGTTTVTGKVYDPAGKNPLYDVAVYVPATALQALPKGVPTGADACSCAALFKSGAVVDTTTGVDGSFTLSNVPVGSHVPLVLQIGKWRRVVHIDVTACKDNAQPDKSLALPATVAAGSDDAMPDIAVSTGGADTLECLMRRIGLPASEYVAGGGTTGHVHVFSGGDNSGVGGGPERNPMPNAPKSSSSLWASQDQLMPYDILLLSCEGDETLGANPPALEAYLNAGGRAFGSHFHYAWFSGPIGTMQSYAAPADWGANLATFTTDQAGNGNPIGGILVTTLNGTSAPFAKGVALQQWLTGRGALGTDNVAAGELAIYQPRYNATVSPSNKPSQPWITSDSTGLSGATMYFSFDTPVDAPAPPDGGAPNYCGRAVFSDLHVAGNPLTKDTPNTRGGQPPPDGCSTNDLSPQELALEFMLFDLSSCVIPDTIAPPDAGVPIK